MKISFNCPKCQTKYSASPEQVGKEGICKNCGATIFVPDRQADVFTVQEKRESPQNSGRKWLGALISIAAISLAIAFGGIGKECGRSVARKVVQDFESGKSEVLQSDQAINRILQSLSKQFNEQCPMQADKYTILLNTTALNRKIVYTYKLDVNSLLRDTGLNLSNLEDAQRESMRNNFCTNPDFDTFKKYDVTMEYNYQDMDSRHLFSFSVDKGICDKQ